MRGIAQVQVVDGCNDGRDAPALSARVLCCTSTRIAVHVDCTMQRSGATANRPPLYAVPVCVKHRTRATARTGSRVRDRHCAGWEDGCGSTRQ